MIDNQHVTCIYDANKTPMYNLNVLKSKAIARGIFHMMVELVFVDIHCGTFNK